MNGFWAKQSYCRSLGFDSSEGVAAYHKEHERWARLVGRIGENAAKDFRDGRGFWVHFFGPYVIVGTVVLGLFIHAWYSLLMRL